MLLPTTDALTLNTNQKITFDYFKFWSRQIYQVDPEIWAEILWPI